MNIKNITTAFQMNEDNMNIIQDLIKQNIDMQATINEHALHTRLLKTLISQYVDLEKKVDGLLKNTLPEEVAEELKAQGSFLPREYDCTILFTDLVGFTQIAEKLGNVRIIQALNGIFTGFDSVVSDNQGTKIKTIGDSYMAVFGAPAAVEQHPVKAVQTALSMLRSLDDFNVKHRLNFQMRIGVHTGKVMGGVVGTDRMQFDIFGDTVNIASRFESSGEKGKVNVSQSTYNAARGFFKFQERGLIPLKNKEAMNGYFAEQDQTFDVEEVLREIKEEEGLYALQL